MELPEPLLAICSDSLAVFQISYGDVSEERFKQITSNSLLRFAYMESSVVIHLDELQLFRFVDQELLHRFITSWPRRVIVVVYKDDALATQSRIEKLQTFTIRVVNANIEMDERKPTIGASRQAVTKVAWYQRDVVKSKVCA